MRRRQALWRVQELGLLAVIVALGVVLAIFGQAHDPTTGRTINTFLTGQTLTQMATDASLFAIMAVGATAVIVSGGIDLSVGSIAALSGVAAGLVLKSVGLEGAFASTAAGLGVCLLVGLLCGLANGGMIVLLGVHPFVITLGTLWIYRGMAFVATRGESILLPASISEALKARFGLPPGVHPIPLTIMIVVAVAGALHLTRTVSGRRVFAIGGSAEASRYAGVPIGRTLITVYAISGLTAALAAFVAGGYYGAVSSGDSSGYELYVIASAVVGGVSLAGGKGSALGATLGAVMIVMIRQAIRTLRLEQNYEWIIVGAAIIVAVVLDRAGSRLAAKRLQ